MMGDLERHWQRALNKIVWNSSENVTSYTPISPCFCKKNLTFYFNMAMSQAAFKVEQALGHGDNATTAQDVTNPGNKAEWGNPNETMKALAWMGKNKVEVGKYNLHVASHNLDER